MRIKWARQATDCGEGELCGPLRNICKYFTSLRVEIRPPAAKLQVVLSVSLRGDQGESSYQALLYRAGVSCLGAT